jgi:hypothetical protein
LYGGHIGLEDVRRQVIVARVEPDADEIGGPELLTPAQPPAIPPGTESSQTTATYR